MCSTCKGTGMMRIWEPGNPPYKLIEPCPCGTTEEALMELIDSDMSPMIPAELAADPDLLRRQLAESVARNLTIGIVTGLLRERAEAC